jgi:hypothetical protein
MTTRSKNGLQAGGVASPPSRVLKKAGSFQGKAIECGQPILEVLACVVARSSR